MQLVLVKSRMHSIEAVLPHLHEAHKREPTDRTITVPPVSHYTFLEGIPSHSGIYFTIFQTAKKVTTD